jgi:hypothetical protein
LDEIGCTDLNALARDFSGLLLYIFIFIGCVRRTKSAGRGIMNFASGGFAWGEVNMQNSIWLDERNRLNQGWPTCSSSFFENQKG